MLLGWLHRESKEDRALAFLVVSTRQLMKGQLKLMADLSTLQADLSKFVADTAAALGRAQASIDALKNAGLTPAQQAIVDSIDSAVQEADANVSAFDVPAPAPAPEPAPEPVTGTDTPVQ